MARPSLSLVFPAYNEQERLPRLLEVLRSSAPGDVEAAGLELAEAVIVDDGSTDGTRALLARADREDPLVRALMPSGANRGKGAAVAAGAAVARGDLILITDVDLSAPLADVGRLNVALERGADVVIGSRALAEADVVSPRHRALAGRSFHLFVRRVTGLPYRDTQCGFKLLPADLARELLSDQIVAGFAFDVELLMRARRAGLRIAEAPVTWTHDESSRVRMVSTSAAMAFDVLRLAYRLRGPAGAPDLNGRPAGRSSLLRDQRHSEP